MPLSASQLALVTPQNAVAVVVSVIIVILWGRVLNVIEHRYFPEDDS
jgi:hypothetical protein